jgi:hypothetical protein
MTLDEIYELARQLPPDQQAELASRLRTLTQNGEESPAAPRRSRPDDGWEYPPDPPPRPRDSLTDDLIDVPDDITDPAEQEAYREAARRVRPKIYQIAREYWEKVGDHERLALSDEDLDQVFWLIDHERIPRFLHEKGQIVLPPDPLEGLIGAIDTDQTDLSETVREGVAEHFRKKHDDSD